MRLNIRKGLLGLGIVFLILISIQGVSSNTKLSFQAQSCTNVGAFCGTSCVAGGATGIEGAIATHQCVNDIIDGGLECVINFTNGCGKGTVCSMASGNAACITYDKITNCSDYGSKESCMRDWDMARVGDCVWYPAGYFGINTAAECRDTATCPEKTNCDDAEFDSIIAAYHKTMKSKWSEIRGYLEFWNRDTFWGNWQKYWRDLVFDALPITQNWTFKKICIKQTGQPTTYGIALTYAYSIDPGYVLTSPIATSVSDRAINEPFISAVKYGGAWANSSDC